MTHGGEKLILKAGSLLKFSDCQFQSFVGEIDLKLGLLLFGNIQHHSIPNDRSI